MLFLLLTVDVYFVTIIPVTYFTAHKHTNTCSYVCWGGIKANIINNDDVKCTNNLIDKQNIQNHVYAILFQED